MKLKKYLSYILPFRIKQIDSDYSGKIELNFTNGKLTLDTPQSNYSYGSLQSVLRKGLMSIRFNKHAKHILVLGMGGGSVIQTIVDEFHSDAFIDAVEIDSAIIDIAINDFAIKRIPNLHIIKSDAWEYLENCSKTYDLIIVDLFLIDTIPTQFTQPPFLEHLARCIHPGGHLIYNTMRHTLPRDQFTNMIQTLEHCGIQTTVLDHVEWNNDLIIGECERK